MIMASPQARAKISLPRGVTVEPEPFNGRHWWQMPGTSSEIRLLNFALFRRGELDLDDVDAGQELGMRIDRRWQDVRARKGLARRLELAREREAEGEDPLAEIKRRGRAWAAKRTGRSFPPLPVERKVEVDLREEGDRDRSVAAAKKRDAAREARLREERARAFRELVEELTWECLARGVSRAAVLATVGMYPAQVAPNKMDGTRAISDRLFLLVKKAIEGLRAGKVEMAGRRRSRLSMEGRSMS